MEVGENRLAIEEKIFIASLCLQDIHLDMATDAENENVIRKLEAVAAELQKIKASLKRGESELIGHPLRERSRAAC